MKNILQRFLALSFFIACFLFTCTQSKASHIVGGDMSYQCLGGSMYQLTFKIYRDCQGIPMCLCPGLTGCSLANVTVTGADPGCSNLPASVTMTVVSGSSSGYDVIQLCRGAKSLCTNCGTRTPGSFTPGVEVYTFVGTINLSSVTPATCCNIVVGYSDCCRNDANTIFQNPSGLSYFVGCTINRCATSPCSSSPIFTNDPVVVVCAGQEFTYNLGAIDPEGDSLSYAFGTSMVGVNTSVPYKVPYTATTFPFPFLGAPNPNLPAPLGIEIDPVTGRVRVTPTGNFVANLVIEVTQWRNLINGTPYKVGITRRDIQFYSISNCAPDDPPKIITYNQNNQLISSSATISPTPTTIPGGYVAKTKWTVCAKKQLCFYIEALDGNTTTDTTDLTWNAPSDITNPANGTYSFTPDYTRDIYPNSNDHVGILKFDKWKFCWTPSAAAYRANKAPYYFSITSRDRMCPVPGRATITFAITVNQTPEAIISVDSSYCNNYRFKYALTSTTSNMVLNHSYTRWFVETAPGSGQYIQKNRDANNNYTMSTSFATGGRYNMYLRLSADSVTTTNSCPNDSIPFSVVVPNIAQVNIPDYSVCVAPTIQVKASSLINQPDSNLYEYSVFSNNIYSVVRPLSLDSFATLSVPNYGVYQYKLRVVDSLGCSNEKLFVVTKKGPQQITGRDSTIAIAITGNTVQCVNNNSFVLSNVTNQSTYKYFLWKLNDGTVIKDTIGGVKQSFNNIGTNYITLMMLTDTIGCNADSNFATVNINPLPSTIANITGTINKCSGDSILLSPLNYDSTNNYVWYYKNGNSPRVAYPLNQSNVYVNQAGSYYLWVQNKTTQCIDSSAIITINISSKVLAVITPSKQGPICNNQNIVLSGPSNTIYQWIKNNGLISSSRTVSINTVGLYTLITNSGICSDTAYYTATSDTFKISASASPLEYKCLHDSLLVTPTSIDTNNNYVWYYKDSLSARVAYPLNQTNIYMKALGKYYLWAQNKNNYCIDSTSAINFVGPPKVYSSINPSKAGTYCNAEPISLTGPNNTNYLWLKGTSNLGNSKSININQAGTYQLITGSGVCADTSSYTASYSTVNVSNNGNVASFTFCPSNANVNAKIKSVGNAQSYTWYNGSNLLKSSLDTFIKISSWQNSGILKVIATNNTGCKDSLNINMNALPMINSNLSVSPDSIVCIGKSVSLSSPFTIGAKYYFQNFGSHLDSSSNSIKVTQFGNYRLVLKTTSSGCKDTSRTVIVDFVSAPVVSVLPKDTALYCAGSSVTLTANGTASNYQWKLNNQNIAGANANTYQASQAGVYTVVNKTGQCADSASLLAIEIPLPTKPNINTFGDTMTSTTTAAQYQWYLNGNAIAGANAQSYVGLQNGLYRVKVSNSFGCSDSSMDYTFVKSGIVEMGREDIKLYPNPTSNYSLLELANIATWQVQINDVSGKTLRSYKSFKGKELMIQKDELKASAYLVQIKNMDSHKTATLKLIIE